MTELRVTRGLPGSGKTTFARAWVEEDLVGRARVNRDELRVMLHNGRHEGDMTEGTVVNARDAMICMLLDWGISVVVDETALPERTMDDLRAIAADCGVEVTVTDLRDVPLDVCLTRNAIREHPVPEEKIRDMHARYIAQPVPW